MDQRSIVLAVAVAFSATWGAAPAGAQSAGPTGGASDSPPALTAPVEAAPEPPAVAEPIPASPEPAATPESTPSVLDPADFSGALTTTKTDPAPSDKPATGDTSLAAVEQAEQELAEYDPWVPFNEKTFSFNHGLDTHVLKPVATAYDKVVPNIVQRAVKNMFENIGSFRRIINTALQGRFDDMGQELGRFVINTVFGLGGFVDAAPSFGVKDRVEADTGQTFGVWGAGPGPYLVLPLLPPLTVRDAFGFVFDTALDPLTWVAPFAALAGVTTEKTVNDRSLNLELYEGVEESVFDLYAAVRNAYLQRRDRAVREGRAGGAVRRQELELYPGRQ